jgi:hypothetical protein
MLCNTLAHADRVKSRRVDAYRDEMTLSRLLVIELDKDTFS